MAGMPGMPLGWPNVYLCSNLTKHQGFKIEPEPLPASFLPKGFKVRKKKKTMLKYNLVTYILRDNMGYKYCSRHGFLQQRMNTSGTGTK